MADSDPEVQFNTLKSCDDTIEVAPGVDNEDEAEHTAYYTLPSGSDTDDENKVQNFQGDMQRRESNPPRNNNINSSSGGHGDNQRDEPCGTNKRPGRRVNFDENMLNDDMKNNEAYNRRSRRRATYKPEHYEIYSDSDDNEHDERRLQRRQNRYRQHGRRIQHENNNTGYESDTYDNDHLRGNHIRNKSNLPTIKPAVYDGTEDWESYFSHFLNCADLGRWSDEEKALTLASCLKGSARTFYLGLRPREQKIYAILEQKLSERFGSSRQQTRYLTKFETRKRNIGEAIASYGDDLRLLARRAYPDLGSEAQESLALHQLYKNITLDLKYKCMDKSCSTIEEAVEIVERCESILGVDDRKRSTVRSVAEGVSENTVEKGSDGSITIEREMMNQMKNILNRLDKMESKIEEAGLTGKDDRKKTFRYERKFTGCFLCNSMDHYAKDCPRRGQKSGNFKPLV